MSAIFDTPAGDAVVVGQTLPQLVFGPITRAMLALYGGASGDHNPIHIDSDYAKAAGQPDVFAHGMLSFGVLASAVTGWIGQARLLSFEARFLAITFVGDTITCQGEVTEIRDEDGRAVAVVELAAVSQDGRRTLAGIAKVKV